MKHPRFLIPIVIVLFCSNAQVSGQADFTIQFPTDPVTASDTIEVTVVAKASLLNRSLSAYPIKWSVTGGEIVEGQGTPTIQVQTDETAEALTARVEISDVYPQPVLVSGTLKFDQWPLAENIDEFDFSTQGYVKMKLDGFFVELNNNPDNQGHVVIFPKTERQRATIERIVRTHIKWRKFDNSRLTIVRGMDSSQSAVQFWLVPPGATLPELLLPSPRLPRLPLPRRSPQPDVSSNPWDIN